MVHRNAVTGCEKLFSGVVDYFNSLIRKGVHKISPEKRRKAKADGKSFVQIYLTLTHGHNSSLLTRICIAMTASNEFTATMIRHSRGTVGRFATLNAAKTFLISALVLLLMTTTTTTVEATSYSVSLRAGQEECFVVRAPMNAPAVVHGNYDCLDDDASGYYISVRLLLYNEKRPAMKPQVVWRSESDKSEEMFKYHNSKGGRFSMCMKNNAKDNAERWVGFALRVAPPPRAMDTDEIGPDQERALELAEDTDELLEQYKDLLDHYDYLRDRESAHRALTEQTFVRVVGWTMVEACTLMFVAVAQVMYLKKFLEKRSYL